MTTKKTSKIAKRKIGPVTDYGALSTTEAKEAAVEGAETVAELSVMWATWEERGQSREGILYAMVLARKQELGYELTDEEEATIELAAQRQRDGRNLPPIVGRMRATIGPQPVPPPPSNGAPPLTVRTS